MSRTPSDAQPTPDASARIRLVDTPGAIDATRWNDLLDATGAPLIRTVRGFGYVIRQAGE